MRLSVPTVALGLGPQTLLIWQEPLWLKIKGEHAVQNISGGNFSTWFQCYLLDQAWSSPGFSHRWEACVCSIFKGGAESQRLVRADQASWDPPHQAHGAGW